MIFLFGVKMKFEPHNRHLWIRPKEEVKEDKESPLFVMPNEYQPPKSPYVVGEILAMACDCEISLDVGDTIVVERTTVQEIKADSETIYVVKENYVYGRIEE
jgi:co-chaperonin GroES (HSP10)